MSAAQTRARFAARLAPSLPRLDAAFDIEGALSRKAGFLRGDFQSDPRLPRREKLTPAAVLVALVEHPEGLNILLTQRTAHLSNHAGQISFPGGRIEPGDRSAVATALREAEEEIGLPPARVELAGRLDDYVTGTGFVVAPIVGFIRAPYPSAPDPAEVAEMFEVPLSFILDPANHRRDSKVFNGVERYFHAMPYGDRYIWGATAAMLMNLYDVLRD